MVHAGGRFMPFTIFSYVAPFNAWVLYRVVTKIYVSRQQFIQNLVEKLGQRLFSHEKNGVIWVRGKALKTMENHKLSVNESDVTFQNVQIKLNISIQSYVVNVQILLPSFAWNACNKSD